MGVIYWGGMKRNSLTRRRKSISARAKSAKLKEKRIGLRKKRRFSLTGNGVLLVGVVLLSFSLLLYFVDAIRLRQQQAEWKQQQLIKREQIKAKQKNKQTADTSAKKQTQEQTSESVDNSEKEWEELEELRKKEWEKEQARRFEEAQQDPAFAEIIKQLGWSEIDVYPLGVNWSNHDGDAKYRHTNDSFQLGRGSLEDLETVVNILQAQGFSVDWRTANLAPGDEYDYHTVKYLLSNGSRMLGIIDYGGLKVADFGSLSSWQESEQRYDDLATTDPVFSHLRTIEGSWTFSMGAGLVWNRNDEEYANTVSFEVSSPAGWQITSGDLGSQENYERVKTQVEQALERADYHIDPIRTWTYTLCGGVHDGTIYTNGGQVYVLGYDEHHYKYNGARRSAGYNDLWLQYMGPQSLLEDKERELKIPASVGGQRRDTIAGIGKNDYAQDERYIVFYETHCTDNSFVYYRVVDGKPVRLAGGLAWYIDEEKCREWEEDPNLDEADRKFLRERFCEKKDGENGE